MAQHWGQRAGVPPDIRGDSKPRDYISPCGNAGSARSSHSLHPKREDRHEWGHGTGIKDKKGVEDGNAEEESDGSSQGGVGNGKSHRLVFLAVSRPSPNPRMRFGKHKHPKKHEHGKRGWAAKHPLGSKIQCHEQQAGGDPEEKSSTQPGGGLSTHSPCQRKGNGAAGGRAGHASSQAVPIRIPDWTTFSHLSSLSSRDFVLIKVC